MHGSVAAQRTLGGLMRTRPARGGMLPPVETSIGYLVMVLLLAGLGPLVAARAVVHARPVRKDL